MRTRIFASFVASLLALVAACTPKIGDECATSIDCSQQGDRLCDVNQPGGYCTVFNCEPDTCPEEDGVCVAFSYVLDPVCKELDDGRWSRFERTFCMQQCESDGDCRSGYACVEPASRSSIIVDQQPLSTKVCLVAATTPLTQVSGAQGVCGPSQADIGNWVPYAPVQGGAGGASSSSSSSGAGGQGGG